MTSGPTSPHRHRPKTTSGRDFATEAPAQNDFEPDFATEEPAETTSGPTYRRARHRSLRFSRGALLYLPFFFLFLIMSSGDSFGSGGFSLLMLFAAMSISIF